MSIYNHRDTHPKTLAMRRTEKGTKTTSHIRNQDQIQRTILEEMKYKLVGLLSVFPSYDCFQVLMIMISGEKQSMRRDKNHKT